MKQGVQRRLSERVGVIAAARIVLGGSSFIDCKIVDVSSYGARLQAPFRSRIPSPFTLLAPSLKLERQAEVVWSSGDEIGVHFLFDTMGVIDLSATTPAAPPASQDSAPVPAEPAVTTQIEELRALAGRACEQPRPNKPSRLRSIFGDKVLLMALLIVCGFCAFVFFGPGFDPSVFTGQLATGQRSEQNAGSLGARPARSSSKGQGDVLDAAYAELRGLGPLLPGVFEGGSPEQTPGETPASGRSGSGEAHPPNSRGEVNSPAQGFVSPSTRAPGARPAGPAGPVGYAQPVTAGLAPAEAGPSSSLPPGMAVVTIDHTIAVSGPSPSLGGSGTESFAAVPSIVQLSRLDEKQIEKVKACLGLVLSAPWPAETVVPHFVFLDACLPKHATAAPKPAKPSSPKRAM